MMKHGTFLYLMSVFVSCALGSKSMEPQRDEPLPMRGYTITTQTIQEKLEAVGDPGFPEIPFFQEFAKPDRAVAWDAARAYEHFAFSYETNKYIRPMKEDACRIALVLAQENARLIALFKKEGEILESDPRLRALIDRYKIIAHIFFCFEQTPPDGRSDFKERRLLLRNLFTPDFVDAVLVFASLKKHGVPIMRSLMEFSHGVTNEKLLASMSGKLKWIRISPQWLIRMLSRKVINQLVCEVPNLEKIEMRVL